MDNDENILDPRAEDTLISGMFWALASNPDNLRNVPEEVLEYYILHAELPSRYFYLDTDTPSRPPVCKPLLALRNWWGRFTSFYSNR